MGLFIPSEGDQRGWPPARCASPSAYCTAAQWPGTFLLTEVTTLLRPHCVNIVYEEEYNCMSYSLLQ